MYRVLLGVWCVLFATAVFGQDVGYAPIYQASAGQQIPVVQQQIVNPSINPIQQLPVGSWIGGMRETYTNSHEIRPIHEWENQQYQQPIYQQYQQPITYPQYPQYPQYQQQYCQPVCQQYRPVCQQYQYCQPYQQYCQPCRTGWWYPGCNLGY